MNTRDIFAKAVRRAKVNGVSEFVRRYNSGLEASKATGANHAHILECCNGKRYKTVGGFIWKFDLI